MQSRATAEWQGDLMSGKGTATAGSGVFRGAALTWKARTEGVAGATTPEELLAASHASCFSMALSHALAQNGHAPEELRSSATVTFQPGEGITRIALTVEGTVPGIDGVEFEETAQAAKENCPVSKALAAVPEISLEAQLVG